MTGKRFKLFITCFLLGMGILFFGSLSAVGFLGMTESAENEVIGAALFGIAGGICIGLVRVLIKKIGRAFREL